jgi:biotin carboxyl carrier protein
MRKFNITVNGKQYEVDVEEVGGAPSMARPASPAPVAVAAAPVAPAAPVAAAQPAAAPAASANIPEGGVRIESPMPGTILDIRVKVGDMVKTGDILLILEAMKMENEIMAPSEGRILAVGPTKGASVNSGELLVVIG